MFYKILNLTCGINSYQKYYNLGTCVCEQNDCIFSVPICSFQTNKPVDEAVWWLLKARGRIPSIGLVFPEIHFPLFLVNWFYKFNYAFFDSECITLL